MFRKIKHIHFVGIGGVGMSGIAEILSNMGYKVTGSDIKESPYTLHLKDSGVKVFIGHNVSNVKNAEVVVYSSAVIPSNPEVKYALKNKIPVIKRAEMLSELMRLKYSIAVAGTHGKTTTTSMIAWVLTKCGFDPTAVVGGKVSYLKSGANLGKGEYLVAEADESDGSFLKLNPTISVVTNIDNDHMDYYGTFDRLKNTFLDFINKTPFYGASAVCWDDKNIRALSGKFEKKIITYGRHPKAHLRLTDLKYYKGFSRFKVYYNNKYLSSVSLSMPGEHNALNALAAIAVACIELGANIKEVAAALKTYQSVFRRLNLIYDSTKIKIYDDYAHHPTEVRSTLSAVRSFYKGKITAVFQPHRYTRTAELYKDFGASFKDADLIILTDIYTAGEKSIKGVSAELIYKELKKRGKKTVYMKEKNDLSAQLKNLKIKKGLIITLGAGDIYKQAYKLAAEAGEVTD